MFLQRGQGCRVWDVDGNELIDYVGTWGPAILGHAPRVVREAGEDWLLFDFNHPLAGKSVRFDVHVVGVL